MPQVDHTTNAQPQAIPSLSFWDNLRYNLTQVLPYYTRGTVTRNKFWTGFWARVHPDPMGVRFFSRLRQKYQSDYLYLYQLKTKTLVVLDEEGIQQVLDQSPHIYAEPKLKQKTMAHFQPGALTISRGKAWTERRSFNQAVLDPDAGNHPYAAHFLQVIQRELAGSSLTSAPQLVWQDFADLFERITLQIIFGEGNHDTELTHALASMMQESNRVFALKPSAWFDGFHAKIAGYVANPAPNSLAALCSHVPSTPETKISSQIAHWIFAMKDTLAENVVYTLALIVAHPAVEQHVRDEMAQNALIQNELATPEQITSLHYLEASIQEAMRAWPSVTQIARETVVEETLGAATIPRGTQVLILNNFNHRDQESLPDADAYKPERWLDGVPDYRFNHFSHGPQDCVGQELALFIAKAVVATMFRSGHYTLLKPTLRIGGPLPHAFNHFGAVFSRTEEMRR